MKNPFEFSKIIVIDPTGETLKIALFENGIARAFATTRGQTMETLFQNLSEVAGDEINEIEAFLVCTGTGSILGTRTATVAISTIAKFSGAKIFEWNCMQVAARAIADKGEDKFSLFTPSRKGFANLLNFDKEEKFLKEITIDKISEIAFDKKISLFQRTNTPAPIAEFERFDLDEQTAFETLKRHPELLSECLETPDAKSLTKREYVKWKAQAHI